MTVAPFQLHNVGPLLLPLYHHHACFLCYISSHLLNHRDSSRSNPARSDTTERLVRSSRRRRTIVRRACPSKHCARLAYLAQFTHPTEFGEPLNIIVSGSSDPYILTYRGFQQYTKSVSIAINGTPHKLIQAPGHSATPQNASDCTTETVMRPTLAMETVASLKWSLPGNTTFPCGGRAGRV